MFASFRYVSRRLLSQGVALGSVVPAFQAEERNAGYVKIGSPLPSTLIQRRDVLMASILAFLCLALFLYRLGDRDLTSSHEARAGQDAQSMLLSERWDLPRLFDGRVEMQKPPLYYWLVALFGWLNGGEVDASCVRMPAALAACGCVLLMFAWGIARGRPVAGFMAALMLATALHFTTLARTGRIDMPLTLTVALTLVSFVQGYQRRQSQGGRSGWGWFLAGYLATAAGVMLKGPIAVVLPLTVGVAWWVIACRNHGIRSVARCDLHWGIPLVLVLAVPWYWWANWRTDGEWFRVFFWYHNVERGLGTEDKLRAYPFWFYGPQLLRDLLPWSLLLPLGLIHVWRNRWDKEARFGAVWLLAMVLLLSCMRFKRADYLLPAFPGAAWMLGCAGESWCRQNPGRGAVAAFSSIVGLTVALWLGFIVFVIPALEETRTHRRFANEVRRHTGDKVFFFQAESHNVAFCLGPPVRTLLEWENLDVWAGKPQPIHVVMSPECAKEWRRHLKAGTLEVLATSEGLARPAPGILSWLRDLDESVLDNHERPLVLLRTHCLPKS